MHTWAIQISDILTWRYIHIIFFHLCSPYVHIFLYQTFINLFSLSTVNEDYFFLKSQQCFFLMQNLPPQYLIHDSHLTLFLSNYIFFEWVTQENMEGIYCGWRTNYVFKVGEFSNLFIYIFPTPENNNCVS